MTSIPAREARLRFVPDVTPVEAAPRLAEAVGLGADDLVVKRDDLIPLGAGGNKARKLEITLREAVGLEADTVVTTGATQSNHARMTAAAAARVGLRCVLVLGGERPGVLGGNLLLDELFGAELVWCGERPLAEVADEVVHELGDRGRQPYLVPYGGSSPASAMSYDAVGVELLDQVPDLAHVVVAVGSGGTMAGLVHALGSGRVLGVHTGAVPDPGVAVRALVDAMPATSVATDPLRLDLAQVGEGYGRLNPAVREALVLAARTEGLVLDPVYTGRALAGLRSAVRAGTIRPGERTVLMHTGGMPGLFGHPEW
jgi:D-cysteine desulfhydrase